MGYRFHPDTFCILGVILQRIGLMVHDLTVTIAKPGDGFARH
jgi:hypothetical protein